MTFVKPLFATTLFLSAFLLFSVQPMVGKALLPLLGGGPSVWNTAMVFFQLLLLVGYFYAYLLSKLPSVRMQALIHLGLLVAAGAIALPLSLTAGSEPPPDGPLIWQLKIMLGMVAAPFFVLSASAPLLQRWFSLSSHEEAARPYSLYAASNAGSLIALLAYPFIIERTTGLGQQAEGWTYGYAALAILGLLVVLAGGLFKKPDVPVTDDEPEPVVMTRMIWVFLAFIPSSLMLGYTTYVTTDVTSAPLLWIIPLSLYLLSFIVAFSDKPFMQLETTRSFHAVFLLFFLWFAMVSVAGSRLPILIIHGLLFFFTALLCHQELSRLKPSPRHLTGFFLYVSIGGALGGLFNSFLAPLIFPLPYEYVIVIVLSGFARMMATDQTFRQAWRSAKQSLTPSSEKTFKDFFLFPGLIIIGSASAIIPTTSFNVLLATFVVLFAFPLNERRWAFALTILLIVACKPLIPWQVAARKTFIERNYYGIHMVEDVKPIRKLTHGTTVHGAQAMNPEYATTPITYYYTGSGGADAFALLDKRQGPQKIAAMGLGVGSIGCYRKADRSFDFYEIDPSVAALAQNTEYFTYLSKCQSPYRIILGDARLKIAEAPDQAYDMIFIDVFSSDNIPIHILTREAVSLYLRKLKPDGMIVFHTSNRYFALEPEIEWIGNELGLSFLMKSAQGGVIGLSGIQYYPTKYAVLTKNNSTLESLTHQKWSTLPLDVNKEPWSDNYANVLRALRF